MLKLLVLCQGKPKIRYKAVKMPFAIEHCYLANRFILKIPMHQKQSFSWHVEILEKAQI